MVRVGPGRLLLSGCRGWTPAQGNQGKAGPSFSGQLHPKDRWGTERLQAGGQCRGGLSPVPDRQPRGGVGLRSFFRWQERRAEPSSPRSESDLLSTPLPTQEYFSLLSHQGGRRSLPSGRPRVEPRGPGTPQNPGREEGARWRPTRPVPASSRVFTCQAVAPPFWERGEKKPLKNLIQNYLLYDPAIPLLSIHPEKTITQKDSCTSVFTAAILQ